MPLGLKPESVIELGSGLAYIVECSSAGVTSGTPERIGYISGTQGDDNAPATTQFDEGGHAVNNTSGNREVMLAVNTMQKDKETLEFPTKTSVGKYYHVVYRITPDGIPNVDDEHEWYVLGIAQCDRNISWTTPGAEGPTFTFRGLANTSALTLNLTAIDAGLSSVAIPANDYWSIVQVAVS